MKRGRIPILFALLGLCAGAAEAHTSEGGFVLLLPTTAYSVAGVAAVLLTVVALFVLPARDVVRLFDAKALPTANFDTVQTMTSLISFALMLFALWVGVTGPRDPLSNILPLGFWTLGWIALISLSGLLGNPWGWLNPWTGPYRAIGAPRPRMALPDGLGLWPAIALMVGFAAFLLADIAPADPARLATLIGAYWSITFACLVLFGPRWLEHGDLAHVIFAAYSRLAPLRLGANAGIGGPGWQLVDLVPARAAGLFALTLLAVGSFDGVNETYWWLDLIGVNPLEFPGRSAVVGVTLAGLIASVLGLAATFAGTVWLGLWLSRADVGFATAFNQLALSLLPIALVYHAAHYLTVFLVSIQYTVAAISDPFGSGADWLGLHPFNVTTGFFKSIDTVRLIWLSQAGLVVVGHMWSVLLSHRLAIKLFGHDRRAAIATLPLSLFMIGYTFLGLWLLAAPRGA